MPAALPGVSVVIPTYNALGEVEGLLRQLMALRETYGERLQVIVADDASPDGTADKLAELFPLIEIAAGTENVGFGANVMRGAALARKPYLLPLNTDIELLGDPLPALCAALAADDRLFAVMPLIYNTNLKVVENFARLYAKRGLVWHADTETGHYWTHIVQGLLENGAEFPAQMAARAAGIQPLASLLCGAVFACRSEEFMRLGGFDPRFRPFYWEEVDLDYRARRQEQRCAVVPQVAVLHRHSQTIDKHRLDSKIHHLRMNQLRFSQAHQAALATGQEGLRSARWWWAVRWVREALGPDKELARAYLAAAAGRTDF